MPWFGRKNDTSNSDTKSTDKKEDRAERKGDRRGFVLDRIAALTHKFKAVALKREGLAKVLKWLVILLIVGYAIFSLGGFAGKLGIFTKFFGGGG